MWRRIRKLERRLVEARVASSNREDEEESDTADSSKVGVEGKVDVDDSDPFDGPPIYDVYPNDEADSDFVEPSPIYDNYGEVDQEEELEAAILLDDPTISLNPDVDVGVVIGVSPGIIPNLVELGFLRKCFIQSDMKLWPSKIIPGPADKPVIVVDYKDEEKGYDENQKFDDVGGGGKNILVFDLGSGTFEVSILTIDNNGVFEVLAINGDTLLGGENFDQRVMEYFIKLIREKHTKNMKLSDDVDKEILTWIVMIGNVLHSTGCITIWIFDPGPYNVSDSRTNLFLEGENDAVWMRERANGLGKADSGLDSPICY